MFHSIHPQMFHFTLALCIHSPPLLIVRPMFECSAGWYHAFLLFPVFAEDNPNSWFPKENMFSFQTATTTMQAWVWHGNPISLPLCTPHSRTALPSCWQNMVQPFPSKTSKTAQILLQNLNERSHISHEASSTCYHYVLTNLSSLLWKSLAVNFEIWF